MDAQDAVEQLLRVSDDIRAAVIFERGGDALRVLVSTLLEEDARQLTTLGDALLAAGDGVRDDAAVRQLEAVTPEGGVYVARDGELAVIAIAAPDALVGLVQHDLRALLSIVSRRPKKAKASAAS